MRPKVQIHCLGEFRIEGLPEPVRGRKQIALLGYLASNLGRPCSRSTLASIFWGDRFDDQARQSLRQALSSLGKVFKMCPDSLQVSRESVSLNPARVSVDVIDAETALAENDLESSADIFQRGVFLQSLATKDPNTSDWLAIERAKWQEMARQAVTSRANQLHDNASLVAAEELATWLLAQDSLDEEALRLMMKIKAASGSVSSAVKLYHHFKGTLQSELGVEPSQATIECYDNLQHAKAPNSLWLGRPAVAVLPFKNVSGEEQQEYFVDGLTEDIITELSYWRTFPVIARNSTFVYKGVAVDPRQVAKELGAGFILGGSVRKSGTRIRVSAQLINANTSHHVWAEKYDRELSDVFELQDDLTRSIAAVIEPAIVQFELHRAKSLGTRDVGAWDLYLRGVELTNQFTAEGNEQARRMYERALEADPNYAQPYVGISQTHLQDVASNRVDDHSNAVAAVVEAARQAIRLDENDSSAHVCLGVGYMWSRMHDQAVAEIRQAVECNPSNAFAYVALGNVLDVYGDPEQGIPLIEIGLKLNPLEPKRPFAMTWLGGAFLNARRYEEALTALQRALSKQTDYALTHLFIAISLTYLGRLAEARTSLQNCERVDPGFAKVFLDWRAYRLDSDNEHMAKALGEIGLS